MGHRVKASKQPMALPTAKRDNTSLYLSIFHGGNRKTAAALAPVAFLIGEMTDSICDKRTKLVPMSGRYS